MTVYFVRSATARDMAAVSQLLAETWHATYDGIYGAERVSEITASWHNEAALRGRLGQPDSEFLVADDGTRLGGMAFARTASDDRTLLVLHQLYVHPDAQGQGSAPTSSTRSPAVSRRRTASASRSRKPIRALSISTSASASRASAPRTAAWGLRPSSWSALSARSTPRLFTAAAA